MDSSNSAQLVGAFDFKAGPINLFGITSISRYTFILCEKFTPPKESKGFVLRRWVIDSSSLLPFVAKPWVEWEEWETDNYNMVTSVGWREPRCGGVGMWCYRGRACEELEVILFQAIMIILYTQFFVLIEGCMQNPCRRAYNCHASLSWFSVTNCSHTHSHTTRRSSVTKLLPAPPWIATTTTLSPSSIETTPLLPPLPLPVPSLMRS